jgi:hypothetical protein
VCFLLEVSGLRLHICDRLPNLRRSQIAEILTLRAIARKLNLVKPMFSSLLV